MNDPENMMDHDPLEALLKPHLRAELDSQRGRAEARFVAEQGGLQTASPRRGPRHLAIWALWSAGAMAASVGLVWGVVVHRAAPLIEVALPIVPAASLERSTASLPREVGQFEEFRTVDEGTVLLDDDSVARQLRRQVLQTTQWYDPDSGASIEITVPREQIVFIGMPFY